MNFLLKNLLGFICDGVFDKFFKGGLILRVLFDLLAIYEKRRGVRLILVDKKYSAENCYQGNQNQRETITH